MNDMTNLPPGSPARIEDPRLEAPEMPEWLTGAWAREDESGWADEYWTPLRGDMMIGASRSGKGEKLQTWATDSRTNPR